VKRGCVFRFFLPLSPLCPFCPASSARACAASSVKFTASLAWLWPRRPACVATPWASAVAHHRPVKMATTHDVLLARRFGWNPLIILKCLVTTFRNAERATQTELVRKRALAVYSRVADTALAPGTAGHAAVRDTPTCSLSPFVSVRQSRHISYQLLLHSHPVNPTGRGGCGIRHRHVHACANDRSQRGPTRRIWRVFELHSIAQTRLSAE